MKEFKYGLFSRFVYRYANLIITSMLLVTGLIALGGVFKDWKYILPLLVHIILIYVVNRYYMNIYRHFPFTIKADNEKMICTDFMNRRKSFEIYHSDIVKIYGGIFSGNAMKPVYLETTDGKKIGLNQHLKDFNKLITIILSNVPNDLYQEILKKMKELEPPESIKKARQKRASKKK
ncbi:MAG: hypothetical protein D6830_00130 [Ignavibacteria bacterium]|nr:MAG: hypothetical protein D6830_00130 [Ignavibacteria bacterium]